MVFIVIIFMIPLTYTIVMSFLRWNLLRPDLGIRAAGFSNYVRLFTDPFTLDTVGRTFYFVLGAVLIELIAGLCIALALDTEFKGWKIVQSVLLVPFMIAPVVVGYVWRFVLNSDYGPIIHILRQLGLGGLVEKPLLSNPSAAMPVLIVADAWEYIPFVTLVLLAGLKSIPYEPYEAAFVDGASSLQRFHYITLPLLRPSILVAVVIRTLTSLRVFDIVFIMTGGGPGTATETLAFYGYRTAFQAYNVGFSSAINMLTFAIAVFFTILYMKIIGGGKNYA
ncbi:ABC transporter permease [Mesotoga sp. Brook.08.YT.4.2.5.4.]|jgi:multiple sugar transport system permease protein|nr:ABC transporter permease [Mesotoga sp. Brook.08.YT.4.2.5.4.]